MSRVRPEGAPRALPREDTEPWYRQFWPWFLIVLPGTVVVAALSTVYIATRHADDLVVDDYYKTGLAINRQLEKERTAQARGITAELTLLDRQLQLRTTGPLDAAELRLQLSHPLEAEHDFAVTVRATAPGFYSARLPAAAAPNWHWSLDGGPESDWRLSGSLTAANFLDRGTH